jgi:solute carrier family 35 protein F1/2
MTASKDQVEVRTAPAEPNPSMATTTNPPEEEEEESGSDVHADRVERKEKGFLAYFKTKEFYITLVLG